MNAQVRKAIDFRYVDENDWLNYLELGGTLGKALDLKDKETEAIYGLAYIKYNSGNFKEALPLFQMLCQFDHYEAKYFLGLGATRQALKDYNLAGETFSFAALVFPHDPRFPFHAAECHLALENWRQAGSGFEMAELRSKDLPEYQKLHEQALQHISHLQEKLKDELREERES